jgi:hypothetical protein
MNLIPISEFFTEKTQLDRPGGLCLDIDSITGLEVDGEYGKGILKIFHGGGVTELKFHRNSDGGPCDVYEIYCKLEKAISPENFI